MIIKCEDETPIKNLKSNSRKKILFKCSCGKETWRLYYNYVKNEENLYRSCLSKKINNDPIIKQKTV